MLSDQEISQLATEIDAQLLELRSPVISARLINANYGQY